MKYHALTVLILLAALALYGAGFGKWGVAAIAVAMALEAWFWWRVVIGRSSATSVHSRT